MSLLQRLNSFSKAFITLSFLDGCDMHERLETSLSPVAQLGGVGGSDSPPPPQDISSEQLNSSLAEHCTVDLNLNKIYLRLCEGACRKSVIVLTVSFSCSNNVVKIQIQGVPQNMTLARRL